MSFTYVNPEGAVSNTLPGVSGGMDFAALAPILSGLLGDTSGGQQPQMLQPAQAPIRQGGQVQPLNLPQTNPASILQSLGV